MLPRSKPERTGGETWDWVQRDFKVPGWLREGKTSDLQTTAGETAPPRAGSTAHLGKAGAPRLTGRERDLVVIVGKSFKPAAERVLAARAQTSGRMAAAQGKNTKQALEHFYFARCGRVGGRERPPSLRAPTSERRLDGNKPDVSEELIVAACAGSWKGMGSGEESRGHGPFSARSARTGVFLMGI